MTIQVCDKCGKQSRTFAEQAVRFPVVEVRTIKNYASEIYDGKLNNVDLCVDCQHDVYNFIFGEETE